MNGDWWFAVFWILLIPLIIVEIIIFLKSRRFFWLVYALSIFTYIVAVSYTIDVFDLGRNAVILTLLASAVLMFLIGRQLGKKVKKQKRVPRLERNIAIGLGVLMVLLFVVSVIFGKASETVTPVSSIKESDIVKTYDAQKGYPGTTQETVVLKRTVANRFFLPVPVEQHNYRGCLVTDKGTFEIQPYSYAPQNEEIKGGETKSVDVKLQPYYHPSDIPTKASELRIYVSSMGDYSYAPCESISREPDYTIPVQ